MKVLVLGDGLLGGEIIKQTQWDCLSRKKGNFHIDNVESISADYDVIVNCIANTDTYGESKDDFWNVNYQFVDRLIDFCNKNSMKLVQISTDYVYTGSESCASESSVPLHCNNWYGYTKLLSDGLVQLRSENYLLCRCTQIPKPFPYEKGWIDRIGNLDYVDVIADLIIQLIKKNLSGLYNVGTEVKSTYELAKQTRPNVGKSLKPKHVPGDLTMNVSKLESDLHSPFFSIAIPTYGYNGRGGEFLEFSLDIINKQTFKDYEVVLSDHSTDDTIKKIYEKWSDKMNISYVRNEHGRGIISPNINNAMKLCKGKWIKVLFQDDFLYNEDSLKIQHDFIISKKDLSWLMSTFYHSEDGKSFKNLYVPKWNEGIWKRVGMTYDANNTMGCPSGMTLKNTRENLIFFDEELNWLMDVDFYKRMSDLYGAPKILNEITVVNRIWGSRLTDTIGKELKLKELNLLEKRYA
jgi:dTDP-4-dehydrorhamnose reductase